MPGEELAVNPGEVAMPLAFVATEALPANTALGPEAGRLKVTVVFGTGLPPASLTTADRGVAKAELICADWGVPPRLVMLTGAPELLVGLKLAVPATPAVVAVTV